MWKYYAFKFAEFTLAYLPKRVGYLIARIVADTVYILSPSLRSTVEANMRHVLGATADKTSIDKAVRGVARNAARNYFDLIQIPHLKLNAIEGRLRVHGWHNFEEASARGKGVILVTAHVGSFDMALQVLAVRSVKTIVLVEDLDPPALFDHVVALRESKGLTCKPVNSGVLRDVIQSLHRGEVVLLACDRDLDKDGTRLNFFDEETTLPSGAVRIAMRTGAAIVPAFNLRSRDGFYDVYFEPAVELVQGGDEAIITNMGKIISITERFIKSAPEQWVVLSPIWDASHRKESDGRSGG